MRSILNRTDDSPIHRWDEGAAKLKAATREAQHQRQIMLNGLQHRGASLIAFQRINH
jgi:hypothetical protein